MKIHAIFLIVYFFFFSCSRPDTSKMSVDMIDSKMMQDSIFHNLLKVISSNTEDEDFSDSLAFLILPIDASCPSCRKKTIDSIVKYRNNLKPRHYIIVSANGGGKNISGYFKEQKSELPVIENRLFLDSTNLSYRLELCKDRPTIYYTYKRSAYKKVASVPATVRDDLREFFSGHRN